MLRSLMATLALTLVLPTVGSALELKNVRPMYGIPPLGAPRTDDKCLPGDIIFLSYDIEGLTFDEKTGKAKYTTSLEFIDSTGAKLFQRDTPNEVLPQLGGTRMPGDLHVIMGRNQKPGKYKVKLTVTDHVSKEAKSFDYPIELLPPGFGIVGVIAPAVGFPGQHYLLKFNLIDMKLDAATKKPNAEIYIRVLDSANKPVSKMVSMRFPQDIPEGIDLQKENFVPVDFPIYLNRTGRFTIKIQAGDVLAKKQATLRVPLNVIDTGALIGAGQ